MARENALSIYLDNSTLDKLAETYGAVIEAVQKEALSEQIKNKNYMQSLRNCVGPKLAIGISYNSENTNRDDNRRHYIKIEELN